MLANIEYTVQFEDGDHAEEFRRNHEDEIAMHIGNVLRLYDEFSVAEWWGCKDPSGIAVLDTETDELKAWHQVYLEDGKLQVLPAIPEVKQ